MKKYRNLFLLHISVKGIQNERIFCVGHSQSFLSEHAYIVFSIEKFFQMALYKRLFLFENKLFLIFFQCYLVLIGLI